MSKDLKCDFEKLRDWRIDGEYPPSDELFRCIMKLSEEAALLHSTYHHYTRLAAIPCIFKNSGAFLRLTRLSSARLNDHNECDKFAGKDEATNTYVGCFNHDGSESANLWWLYARGSCRSVRITFPAEQFTAWMDVVRKKVALCTDVVYAAVRRKKECYSQERQNVLCWSDCRIKVKDLPNFLRKKYVAGRMKDYEWRSENETRIIVKESGGDQYQYIPIPDVIIPKLRITLSPWASDDDYEAIKGKVTSCLAPFGWRPTAKNVRKSVLTGAMDVLRKR